MSRINVTKTFLPPLEEYQQYVTQIWDRTQLTNQGPLLLELQEKLKARLGVENFHFVSNGTTALQLALHTLDITEGEVITTPFSYVATTSAILWERCTPIFVDIDPKTFCLDASKIEAAITEKTKAIMPVHVFGLPCDIEQIDAIAQKYNLKVIYDAAHAFGVTYKGRSLLGYGDISIGSFHSTKLFHTIEGGCLIVKDKTVSDKVELVKRFGHHGDEHFMLGINAKANEFQAAMGLCNIKYLEEIIIKRKAVSELYDQLLGRDLGQPPIDYVESYNYAYYPVVFKDEAELQKVFAALAEEDVFPRRYFYPSLNKLPYVKEDVFPRRYFYPSLNKLPYVKDARSCPISEDIADRIACLPLYDSLDPKDVERICTTINSVIKGKK